MGTAWRDYMQDDGPSFGRVRHPATWRLFGACAVLWFLYAGSLGWGGPDSGLFRFIHDHLVLHPEDVVRRGHVWQLGTALFLHDPWSVGHILINSIGLLFFGWPIEERLGSRGLTSLFLRAGLVSTTILIPLWLLTGGAFGAVGASGSIFGLAAFLALREPHMTAYFFVLRMPLWVLVGVLMVGIEVVNLVVLANPGVSTIAHLSGAAYGYVHHRWLAPDRRGGRAAGGLFTRLRDRARAARDDRQVRRESADRQRVEALLDKIARDGIESLTGADKDFLQRASKRYPRP